MVANFISKENPNKMKLGKMGKGEKYFLLPMQEMGVKTQFNFFVSYVSVSLSCHNKVPQTE
jgi:hypothetical protein